MARLFKHELAYDFEQEIFARLKSLRIPRAKNVAQELTPKLMSLVPTEAFELQGVWEKGIVHFHGDVEEEYVRYMQDELSAIHLNVKSGVPITIYLSTHGGDAFAGLTLVSTIQEIRRAGRQVNVHIQGAAFSFGSILAQACDVRTIESTAYFMLHEIAEGIEWAKTSTIKDEAAFLDRLENTVFALYSERTGRPVEYYREKMQRRDWFLTAREAVKEGLVDRIKPVPKYPGKRPSRPKAPEVNA